MGRHGGGSRSSGRRSVSRSSRSSKGGSKISSKPFRGCYNRSYYHKGVYHRCYTNAEDFGTSKLRIILYLLSVIFVSAMMLPFVVLVGSFIVQIGEKVDGNPERIVIQDTIDVLDPEEEKRALELFDEVYSASGMPITLYTDDMEWKNKYSSIEVYSEELYYAMGIEEDAMIILFTYDGTFDWVYDIYCGDDTIKCLSDKAFNELIDNFQKGMAGQELYDALDFSLNSIMDDLAKTYIDVGMLFCTGFCILMYAFVLVIIMIPYLKEKKAYEYFKENPEKVDKVPMSVKSQCPSCGAHNTNFLETCEYCRTVLKM